MLLRCFSLIVRFAVTGQELMGFAFIYPAHWVSCGRLLSILPASYGMEFWGGSLLDLCTFFFFFHFSYLASLQPGLSGA